ncbi:glycosyltransferase [Pontibacter toksunensis]|uniref:Glycosyltransferase n=1 Tax=Pontibacter toksunensis TaxID=1332631 RepID=A0ABW6BNI2_9BACT
MLSVIICCRKPKLDLEFIQNIDATIGCAYEIITVDNSTNKHSIFSAYNKGASQAVFDVLCFVHDDVFFRTNGWGNILAQTVADAIVGVVGVAGAKVKTKNPSPWWIANEYHSAELLKYNIKQKRGGHMVHDVNPSSNPQYSEVLVLDGVLLCCRQSVWEQTKFDETSYAGFHFYDLDFSLSVWKRGFKNYVNFEILLEHNSAGKIDKSWLKASDIFHRKWAHILPVSLSPLDKKTLNEIEYQASSNYLKQLIKNKSSFPVLLKMWSQVFSYKVPGKDHWRLFLSIIKLGFINSK